MKKLREMRPRRVLQADLDRILHYQKALAETHRLWRIARADACKIFLKYGSIPYPNFKIFYCQSIALLNWVKVVYDELNCLLRLRERGAQFEDGELLLSLDPLMVRHVDGNENYPFQLVVLEPDTLIMMKNEQSSLQWVHGNFAHVSDIPVGEAMGKVPDQLWPGADGGQKIRTHDRDVFELNSAALYREILRVKGVLRDRIAIRFPVPFEMKKAMPDIDATLAVIGFDVAAVMKDLKIGTFKKPTRKSTRSALSVKGTTDSIRRQNLNLLRGLFLGLSA